MVRVMFRLPAAAISVALIACGDPTSVSQSLTYSSAPPAQIQIAVEIDGDVSAASPVYQVKLDDWSYSLVPNSSAGVAVKAGEHIVEITPPTAQSFSGVCTMDGESRRSVRVSAGEIVKVTFVLRCSLFASGTGITVTVSTLGDYTPDRVTLSINGEGQFPIRISEEVAPEFARFFAVPPGVYHVAARRISCGPFFDEPSERLAVVTEKDNPSLRIGLYCLP